MKIATQHLEPVIVAISQINLDYWVFPFSFMALAMVLLGLFLPALLFKSAFRRLRVAQGENLRLNTMINEIVTEQNELIASLNNKFGVEQKRWNMELRDRETRLEELSGKLAQFDSNSSTVKQEIAVRDERIRKLQLELNDRLKEVDRLKVSLESDGALAGRVNQLEALLAQREAELRSLLTQRKTQVDEYNRQLQIKQQESDALRHELQSRDQRILEISQAPMVDPAAQNRIAELEGLIATQNVEMEKLRLEMAEQERDINELLAGRDDELHRLRSQLETSAQSEARLRELEKAVQDKTNDLNGYLFKVGELEDLLGERESAIVALQSDLSAKENLRDQYGRVRELENELMRFKREQADQGDLLGKLGLFEGQLRSREIELDRLRSELDNSLRDRDSRLQEFNDLLRQKDNELNHLKSGLGSVEGLRERVKELEWQIGETAGDSENKGRRIEELEYLLWEKDEQIKNLRGEKQNLKDIEHKLGEKESDFSRLKTETEELTAKVRELEWLLGERDGELDFLRREKAENRPNESANLRNKIEELERSLRERDGELERWWNENEALKNQLSSKDVDIEKLRRERTSSEPYRSRVQELEWLLGERDAEIERLRDSPGFDQLDFRLRDLERLVDQKENEIRRLRSERDSRISPASRPVSRQGEVKLNTRVRELERLLNERDRELRGLRHEKERGRKESEYKVLGAERPTDKDLQSRVRQLEWLLEQRNSDFEAPPRRSTPSVHLPSRIRELERLLDHGESDYPSSGWGQPDRSEYRFTLEDGTVVYVKGDDRISYEGRILSASELFHTLEDDDLE